MKLGKISLIPARDKPELVLGTFHTAIVPPQTVNHLVTKLADIAPIRGLSHLKRVRTCKAEKTAPKVEVLLARAEPPQQENKTLIFEADINTSGNMNPLPTQIQALLADCGITENNTAKVPLYPAGNREQYLEWCKIWPLNWHVPKSKSTSKDKALSDAEEKMMLHWMNIALMRSMERANSGTKSNVAVIVDPSTGQEIASGYDETENHPLHHAAMKAISLAAEKDLAMFPPQSESSPPAKRQKTEEEPEKQDCSDLLQNQTATRPYLCTGYDCYVIHEPCTMCAMALVHSRVGRIIYCKQDKSYGALGGSYRLHSQKSLNHHYTVFHIPLDSQDEQPP